MVEVIIQYFRVKRKKDDKNYDILTKRQKEYTYCLKQKFKNCSNIKIIEGAVNTFNGTCYIGFEQQDRDIGLKQAHVMNNNSDLQGRN